MRRAKILIRLGTLTLLVLSCCGSFVCLVLRFYSTVSTIKVISSQSDNMSTLSLGRPPKWLTSTIKCPYLDNCPATWTGREWPVEIISWPNLYEIYVAGPEDWTCDLLNTIWRAHLTDPEGLATEEMLLENNDGQWWQMDKRGVFDIFSLWWAWLNSL